MQWSNECEFIMKVNGDKYILNILNFRAAEKKVEPIGNNEDKIEY